MIPNLNDPDAFAPPPAALAPSREAALEMLEQGGFALLDLNYPQACADITDLAAIGAKRGVCVFVRPVEITFIPTVVSLLEALISPKPDFRQRHLVCSFSLASLDVRDLREIRLRAHELGDVVCEASVLQMARVDVLH